MATPRVKPSARTRPRRFDSPQQEAYLSLWRTYDRLRAIEDELFHRFELTAQQYNLLRLLRGSQDPVPTLTVAEQLVSRAPDITRMLDKLEGRRLIARNRSTTDRRTVLVSITTEGGQLLEQIAGPLKASHEKQLGHLTSKELTDLITLLRTVRSPHEPEGSEWL